LKRRWRAPLRRMNRTSQKGAQITCKNCCILPPVFMNYSDETNWHEVFPYSLFSASFSSVFFSSNFYSRSYLFSSFHNPSFPSNSPFSLFSCISSLNFQQQIIPSSLLPLTTTIVLKQRSKKQLEKKMLFILVSCINSEQAGQTIWREHMLMARLSENLYKQRQQQIQLACGGTSCQIEVNFMKDEVCIRFTAKHIKYTHGLVVNGNLKLGYHVEAIKTLQQTLLFVLCIGISRLIGLNILCILLRLKIWIYGFNRC
jgi:hypothetical protein